MARAEPRGRRARTKAALLHAAAEVFVRRGYEAASLDEIAATAGYTRGAIYSSFEDKEDLFLAVVTGFNDKWIANFENALGQMNARAEPRSLNALWAEFAGSDEQQTRLMMEFRVVALRNESVATRLAQFELRTEEAMAAIAERHENDGLLHPAMPARDIAILLYAASQGILLHEMACRTPHPELFGNLIRLATEAPRGSTSSARRSDRTATAPAARSRTGRQR